MPKALTQCTPSTIKKNKKKKESILFASEELILKHYMSLVPHG
jgi:hypothetical protein